MSVRVMRGTRLGALSYEFEGGAEEAPRVRTPYRCEAGHTTVIPFAEAVDRPPVWECRTCRRPAALADGSAAQTIVPKKVRSHWDMLLERRTFADLEVVLAERLAVLRGGAKPQRRRSA